MKKSALVTGAIGSSFLYPQDSMADTKRFAGKTLRINWPSGVLHFNLARALIRNFSNETGIKIELDSADSERSKTKVFEACAKPVNDYDLVVFNLGWKAALLKFGYLTNLAPLFADPRLAVPDYQFDDLVRGYVQAVGMSTQQMSEGGVFGLPFGCQTSIFAYRKDIFEQHHLTAPVTYEELQRLLIRIRLRAKMPAMTAALGTSKSFIDSWLLHFFPQGENIFQKNWQSNFASESGLKTMELLKVIRDTGPDNVMDFNAQANLEAFLKGEVAVYIDSTSVLGQFRNAFPDAHILDRVGYALHPRGQRYAARCDGYGLGIPNNSAEPEAAFIFAQWMTSRESDLTIVKRGGDFFWVAKYGSRTYALCGDCTGHGVPGAFMTLLAYSALTQISEEAYRTAPLDFILQELHQRFSNTLGLNKQDAVINTGFEASMLCRPVHCFVAATGGLCEVLCD